MHLHTVRCQSIQYLQRLSNILDAYLYTAIRIAFALQLPFASNQVSKIVDHIMYLLVTYIYSGRST